MLSVHIHASGPVFDGRADQELSAALDDIEAEVGHQAYAEWMTQLNDHIQHPTPYYETQITTQRLGGDVVVHDRGIIYGPWLEGTGSRNFPVTSFRGYHSVRKAMQNLETSGKEERAAQRALRPHVERMQ